MQKHQSYQNTETKADKYRRNINRFIAIGGIAAVIALFATDPEMLTNLVAQEIGFYSMIIAVIGICGAAWNWVSLEDLKSGSTITGELTEIKAGFNAAIAYVRKEFEDEFATNQGLDDKNTDIAAAKSKTSIK